MEAQSQFPGEPAVTFNPIIIEGGRQQIGLELGKLARAIMPAYLDQSSTWAALRPWRGHAFLDALGEAAKAALPHIWLELEGLAEGLRMPLEDVLLWNCRGDLLRKSSDGCTSLAWRGADGARWMAHNEDGDPYLRGRCRIVDVRPEGAPGYVGFYYPGSLPGHTFAGNRAGLAQTINNVRARQRQAGVPRMLLARAVLDCTDLDQALDLLRDLPRAGGFHHMLGSARDRRLFSVEASPTQCAIQEISKGYAHANHLLHPGSPPQVITDSSAARQRRAEQLMDGWSGSAGGGDLVTALLDASGELPILRTDPQDPDEENTLATALFELRDGRLSLRVYDRGPEAVLKLDIRGGDQAGP
ncbi:Predicted choloylglycine hydrolase [Bordetella pseudohinzii]|uniref:Predicted choloylglycine hydrolase n=1 Tax=Bordetella pseudohinzii TaxID=1331258 RepID=A0A0M7CH76_9BORD|nr:Predicted choloylglycine hydrolase [Bordetella pseudohinzii]